MPSLIPSRIVLRHSNTQGAKPSESDLLPGEVYLNIPDNKLYYKNSDEVDPIIEINLSPSTNLIHVRDIRLSVDGDIYAVYSDGSESSSLGNIKGPAGRGLAIDGVVNYVDQLPNSSAIANVLNKNGTLFIVRLGDDNETPFDPVGPRIYSYSTTDGGTWTELTGATVAASGLNGTNGNTIISGTAPAPLISQGQNGDYYLDRINYVLFGPKSAGVWPSTGVNLKGIQGIQGEPGLQGPMGEVTAESLDQLLDDLGLGPTDIVPVIGLQLSDTGAVALDSGTLGLNSSGDLVVHNGLSNGDDLPSIRGGAETSTRVGSFIANRSVIVDNQNFYSKIAEWYIPFNQLSTVNSLFTISGKIDLKFGLPAQNIILPNLGIYFALVAGDIDFSFDNIIGYGSLYSPYAGHDTSIDGNYNYGIESNINVKIRTEASIPEEIAISALMLGGLRKNTFYKNTDGTYPLFTETFLNNWQSVAGDESSDAIQVIPRPVDENSPVKISAYIASVDYSEGALFAILDCVSVLHLTNINKYETI